MDVRLSPEQQALRDAAGQLVDRLGPRTVRDLDDAERSAKLNAALDSTGWRELRSATTGGAPLASAVEAALVAEELGRGAVDVAFVGPTLAAELRRVAGAPHATAPETVALDPALASLATSPAGAVAVDAAGASSVLMLEGGELVSVATADDLPTTDLTRRLVGVAPGDQANHVGAGRDAPDVVGDRHGGASDIDVTSWTALALALTCADLVGTMRGAVRLACDHAATRQQFGTVIGSFQAVQHLLADAFVAMEGSRSATLYAAWAVDALPPSDALAAASVAKAYSARAARTVCETAIQVHGGIGNTWECFAHVFLRRALLSTDLLGGIGPSLARVLAHEGIGATDGLR
jgi:alkylation response protein AidB-like acyl-CoA dehydrogenase